MESSTSELFDGGKGGSPRRRRLRTPAEVFRASEEILGQTLDGTMSGGEARATVAALQQHLELLQAGAGAAKAVERLRQLGYVVDLAAGKVEALGPATVGVDEVLDAIREASRELARYEAGEEPAPLPPEDEEQQTDQQDAGGPGGTTDDQDDAAKRSTARSGGVGPDEERENAKSEPSAEPDAPPPTGRPERQPSEWVEDLLGSMRRPRRDPLRSVLDDDDLAT